MDRFGRSAAPFVGTATSVHSIAGVAVAETATATPPKATGGQA